MTTDKPKRKSKNFFHELLADLFSLQREFYFETEMEAEVLADKLNKLGYQKEFTLSQFREGDKWFFELQTMQRGRGGYASTGKASGTLYTNEDKLTVISGTASVGGTVFWILITACVLLALILLPFAWMMDSVFLKIFFSLIFFLPPIMLWLNMATDRTSLLILLRQLTNPAIKEKPSYE